MTIPHEVPIDSWSPELGAPIMERFGDREVIVAVRHLVFHQNEIEGLWPFTPPGQGGLVANRADRLALTGWWAYLLYDRDGVVCYVGQTGSLRARLQKHAANKAFTRWRALRCNTGPESRRLEEVLFDAYRPYLYDNGTRR